MCINAKLKNRPVLYSNRVGEKSPALLVKQTCAERQDFCYILQSINYLLSSDEEKLIYGSSEHNNLPSSEQDLLIDGSPEHKYLPRSE